MPYFSLSMGPTYRKSPVTVAVTVVAHPFECQTDSPAQDTDDSEHANSPSGHL